MSPASTPRSRRPGVRVRSGPGRRPSPPRDGGVSASTPLTPAEADARVDRYRGTKSTSTQVIDFTREAVRDALPAAPQPVTNTWIAYSTSTVGLIAAASEAKGFPLDRKIVFGRDRIDAFLAHECAHLGTGTRASYRSRLDVIATGLSDGSGESAWPRPALSRLDVRVPYTPKETGKIAAWLPGVHPQARRERVSAIVALALGCGLRRRELVHITGDRVTSDEHGVHVSVPAGPKTVERTVTATADWEQTIAQLAASVGTDLLLARGKTSLSVEGLDNVLYTANVTAPVPVVIHRLRNTWLARHIIAGVPLPQLLPQAGLLTLQHLEDLLRIDRLVQITTGTDSESDAASVSSWMRSGCR